MTFEDTLIVTVDFNDFDNDGTLVGTRRFASSLRKPDVGERVFLRDDEGNSCWGRVQRLEGEFLVFLDIDRETWTRSWGIPDAFPRILPRVQQPQGPSASPS